MSNAFTWLFLAALAAAVGTRLWLGARQSRPVRAHRDAVPESFSGTIPLAAHQRAADYTVVKTRVAMLDVLVSAALALALTFGGVLQWLSDAWSGAFESGGIAHGVALIVSVVLLLSLLELPLTVYRTFVVEARFGFNRMTPALFAIDLAKQTLISVQETVVAWITP